MSWHTVKNFPIAVGQVWTVWTKETFAKILATTKDYAIVQLNGGESVIAKICFINIVIHQSGAPMEEGYEYAHGLPSADKPAYYYDLVRRMWLPSSLNKPSGNGNLYRRKIQETPQAPPLPQVPEGWQVREIKGKTFAFAEIDWSRCQPRIIPTYDDVGSITSPARNGFTAELDNGDRWRVCGFTNDETFKYTRDTPSSRDFDCKYAVLRLVED